MCYSLPCWQAVKPEIKLRYHHNTLHLWSPRHYIMQTTRPTTTKTKLQWSESNLKTQKPRFCFHFAALFFGHHLLGCSAVLRSWSMFLNHHHQNDKAKKPEKKRNKTKRRRPRRENFRVCREKKRLFAEQLISTFLFRPASPLSLSTLLRLLLSRWWCACEGKGSPIQSSDAESQEIGEVEQVRHKWQPSEMFWLRLIAVKHFRKLLR